MNHKTLFVFAFIFVLGVSSQLNLDFDRATSSNQNGRYEVQIPCAGGSGPYSYKYSGLPSGWEYKRDGTIEIPEGQFEFPGSYPIRVSVKDAYKRRLRVSIVIVVSVSSISVQNREYDYDYDFTRFGFGSGQYYSAGSSASSSLSSNFDSGFGDYLSAYGLSSGRRFNSGSIRLPADRTSGGSSIRHSSIRYSSVDTLPSSQELDQIIAIADVVAITKTIQEVISSDVICLDKIDYLSNFLGRIRSAIEIKKLKAEEIRVIIQAAEEAIAKLNIEIQELTLEQGNLGVAERKVDLNNAIAELELAYQEFNSAQSATGEYTIKIQEFQREIIQVTRTYEQAKDIVSIQEQTVAEADEIIAELEDRLRIARAKRVEIQEQVDNSQRIADKAFSRITIIKESITELEIKISTQSDTIANLKELSIKLEIEVEEIKASVTALEARNAQLQIKIASISIEIQAQQSKIIIVELTRFEEMISILQNALPKIQENIDSIYYKCRGISEVESTVETNTGSIIYEVSSYSFRNYIRNTYGINGGLRLNRNNVILSSISIFSKDWEAIYGIPFGNSAINLSQDNFFFNDDFTCSSNGVAAAGQIIKINANRIQVRGDDNKDYELELGACSRIEVAKESSEIPRIGDNIYWRGESNTGNKYRISSATCY